MLGNVPKRMSLFVCFCDGQKQPFSYLDLSFPHDLIHDLVVVLVEHALVVTLLVAQDAQVLGALQLDLKLLFDHTDKEKGELNVRYCKETTIEQCAGKKR